MATDSTPLPKAKAASSSATNRLTPSEIASLRQETKNSLAKLRALRTAKPQQTQQPSTDDQAQAQQMQAQAQKA